MSAVRAHSYMLLHQFSSPPSFPTHTGMEAKPCIALPLLAKHLSSHPFISEAVHPPHLTASRSSLFSGRVGVLPMYSFPFIHTYLSTPACEYLHAADFAYSFIVFPCMFSWPWKPCCFLPSSWDCTACYVLQCFSLLESFKVESNVHKCGRSDPGINKRWHGCGIESFLSRVATMRFNFRFWRCPTLAPWSVHCGGESQPPPALSCHCIWMQTSHTFCCCAPPPLDRLLSLVLPFPTVYMGTNACAYSHHNVRFGCSAEVVELEEGGRLCAGKDSAAECRQCTGSIQSFAIFFVAPSATRCSLLRAFTWLFLSLACNVPCSPHLGSFCTMYASLQTRRHRYI